MNAKFWIFSLMFLVLAFNVSALTDSLTVTSENYFAIDCSYHDGTWIRTNANSPVYLFNVTKNENVTYPVVYVNENNIGTIIGSTGTLVGNDFIFTNPVLLNQGTYFGITGFDDNVTSNRVVLAVAETFSYAGTLINIEGRQDCSLSNNLLGDYASNFYAFGVETPNYLFTLNNLISVNQTVYSTGCLGGCNGLDTDFDQSNINDGSFYNGVDAKDEWIGSSATGNVISLELNGTYEINRFVIVDEYGTAFFDREPNNLDVEYSIDNSTWTPIVTSVNLGNDAVSIYDYSFTPVNASYIRLSNIDGDGGSEPRIAEFLVFGTVMSVTPELNATRDNTICSLTTDDLSPFYLVTEYYLENGTDEITEITHFTNFNWTASGVNIYDENSTLIASDNSYGAGSSPCDYNSLYQSDLESLGLNISPYRNTTIFFERFYNSTNGSVVYTDLIEFNLDFTLLCAESWSSGFGSCTDGFKTKFYTDANTCGTYNNLPLDNNTQVICIAGGGGGSRIVPQAVIQTVEDNTVSSSQSTSALSQFFNRIWSWIIGWFK